MKVKFDSKQFYQHHPDLAPRNVYLASERVIKQKDVDKTLKRICRESFIAQTVRKFQTLQQKITEFCVKKN